MPEPVYSNEMIRSASWWWSLICFLQWFLSDREIAASGGFNARVLSIRAQLSRDLGPVDLEFLGRVRRKEPMDSFFLADPAAA